MIRVKHFLILLLCAQLKAQDTTFFVAYHEFWYVISAESAYDLRPEVVVAKTVHRSPVGFEVLAKKYPLPFVEIKLKYRINRASGIYQDPKHSFLEKIQNPQFKLGQFGGSVSQADFKGGTKALFQFIGKNLEMPQQAKENKVKGQVWVKFDIDETGKISNARIEKGLGFGCDEAALAVVNKFTPFLPALDNVFPVKSSFTMPFWFENK